jgi:hypothetical protein
LEGPIRSNYKLKSYSYLNVLLLGLYIERQYLIQADLMMDMIVSDICFMKMTSNALKPNNLRESEDLVTIVSMEKMLLIRKELRVMHMEKKLKEGSVELIKAEEKLKSYESLLWLKVFQRISKTLHNWIMFDMSTVSGLASADLDRESRKMSRTAMEEQEYWGTGSLGHQEKTMVEKYSESKNIDYGLVIIILMSVGPDWLNIFPVSFSIM